MGSLLKAEDVPPQKKTQKRKNEAHVPSHGAFGIYEFIVFWGSYTVVVKELL